MHWCLKCIRLLEFCILLYNGWVPNAFYDCHGFSFEVEVKWFLKILSDNIIIKQTIGKNSLDSFVQKTELWLQFFKYLLIFWTGHLFWCTHTRRWRVSTHKKAFGSQCRNVLYSGYRILQQHIAGRRVDCSSRRYLVCTCSLSYSKFTSVPAHIYARETRQLCLNKTVQDQYRYRIRTIT